VQVKQNLTVVKKSQIICCLSKCVCDRNQFSDIRMLLLCYLVILVEHIAVMGVAQCPSICLSLLYGHHNNKS